jgi:hypothetical protein
VSAQLRGYDFFADLFTRRRAAQYFVIRSLTALRCAADIVERLRLLSEDDLRVLAVPSFLTFAQRAFCAAAIAARPASESDLRRRRRRTRPRPTAADPTAVRPKISGNVFRMAAISASSVSTTATAPRRAKLVSCSMDKCVDLVAKS